MKIARHGSAYRRAAPTSHSIHQWIVLIEFPCLMINNNNNITHRYFWLKNFKFPKSDSCINTGKLSFHQSQDSYSKYAGT